MKISGLFPKKREREREGRLLARPPAESRRGVLAGRESLEREERRERRDGYDKIQQQQKNGFIKKEEEEEEVDLRRRLYKH